MRSGLRDVLIQGKSLLRIGVLTALFAGIGGWVLWDYYRVERDFRELKTLLQDTRNQGIMTNQTLVVRFAGKDVVVTHKETGTVIDTLTVQTLNKVNYDTTLGDNMIVFDGHGTSAYNKREHGGDLSLKSWLGFSRDIAVNCTGLVIEGVYPGE
jgi:hypothetical protein